MDALEKRGINGPPVEGNRPREVWCRRAQRTNTRLTPERPKPGETERVSLTDMLS